MCVRDSRKVLSELREAESCGNDLRFRAVDAFSGLAAIIDERIWQENNAKPKHNDGRWETARQQARKACDEIRPDERVPNIALAIECAEDACHMTEVLLESTTDRMGPKAVRRMERNAPPGRGRFWE